MYIYICMYTHIMLYYTHAPNNNDNDNSSITSNIIGSTSLSLSRGPRGCLSAGPRGGAWYNIQRLFDSIFPARAVL